MSGLRSLRRAALERLTLGGLFVLAYLVAATVVAGLFGPGAPWSGERITVAALLTLGVVLERARASRSIPSRPPTPVAVSMAAGAIGGLHGALVVAPFVALSGVRVPGSRASSREVAAHVCGALAFGGVFTLADTLSIATAWPATLAPGVFGATLAAGSFAAADRWLGRDVDDRESESWEARALGVGVWQLLGVLATGVAAVNDALGPGGVALFALPAAFAQARFAQATNEARRAARALNAMRRQIDLTRARATQDLRALERLAAAVDERCYGDPERSRRVAELAVALLREMPLDGAVISEDELYRAALLRDIGLLRVKEEVLRSPGSLAPDERRAIMAHPEDGFWFLADHGISDNVRQIVAAHHERYDGGGYPRRLRSLGIPLGARILAVADALVAMLSARTYRDALPLQMALQELRLGRGTQFDPDVVDACLALVAAGGLPWLTKRGSAEARRIA